MKTRLACLSNKSDSYTDFTEFLPPAQDRTTRCLKLTKDEVIRWADSFDVLLSHKYGLAAFRAFLKTEFSDENIEFWMACEEYKKIKTPAKLVNIDFRTREVTRQSLEEPIPSSLNEVQSRVHSLMEKDSYPRFLRSKIYQDLLKTQYTHCQRNSV
ncbi:regulator of G-protein signaling 8 isoform 2-T2 [Salvelinus alpinus]